MLARRSRTGYVQLINNAVAYIGSQRKKDQSIDGPTYVICDNQSVVSSVLKAESVLKKKSSSIAYHAVSEAVAMKQILICYVSTNDNVADIMTKDLPAGEPRNTLVEQLLWDITYNKSTVETRKNAHK
jgi:hypothetical protein